MNTIPVEVDNTAFSAELAFQPTEADKNTYLLLAHRGVLKRLMPAIKNLRNYHKQPAIEKAIDNVQETNQAAYQALQAFYQQAFAGRIPDSMKASADRIEKLYLDCAMLPYVTPTDKIPDLEHHVENYYSESYAVVDSYIVDAFLAADGEVSASMRELVNRYFPDAEPGHKEAFAIGVEKLIQVRNNLGVKV